MHGQPASGARLPALRSDWNIVPVCSNWNILAICSCMYTGFGWNFVLNVPVGTLKNGENFSVYVVDSSCELFDESMDSRG